MNILTEQYSGSSVTKTFLEDMVDILTEQYSGSSSQTRRSTLQCIPLLSPTSITSSSLSLTLPVSALDDSILPPKRYPEARRKEVDMSDDKVILLWNRATPSANRDDFDICLGTTKKESDKK